METKSKAKSLNLGEYLGHGFTKEEQSKGGSCSRLGKQLSVRKHCNDSCPIYPCPVAALSINKLCALKQLAPDVQKKLLGILQGGAKGIAKVMVEKLADMLKIVEGRPDSLAAQKIFLEAANSLFRTLYGERKYIDLIADVHEEIDYRELSIKIRKIILEERAREKNST